jgi:hypothetical protein
MTTRTHFYDSASPQNVPSGVYAAVYANGAYRWSTQQVDRMERVFHISVLPDATEAEFARCIDVESGAATPADAVQFVAARRKYGFDDATVYVNRSNWATVRALIAKARLDEPLYWVATLDGTMAVSGAWAVQYHGGMSAAYDVSVLLGVDNFVRP